jgi:hypothetical protein
MLQPGRKVVLSDFYAEEFVVDIDAIFHLMALKGIVNVVSGGDYSVNLATEPLSPMVTTNPDDGMTSFQSFVLVVNSFLAPGLL